MTNVEDTVNKEYIDKHEAYLLLKHKAETYMLPATKEPYEKAAILIDSMKTIEVKPMKRGSIERLTNAERYEVFYKSRKDFDGKCSECGAFVFDTDKLCSMCGAVFHNGERGNNNG